MSKIKKFSNYYKKREERVLKNVNWSKATAGLPRLEKNFFD